MRRGNGEKGEEDWKNGKSGSRTLEFRQEVTKGAAPPKRGQGKYSLRISSPDFADVVI